ncbi:30S ribosomal protein S4 [Candidatus Pacearchaeota archaeon]|nr:30S ribosomal protein S4 [Candidatus Pacearchaeota archaeon]
MKRKHKTYSRPKRPFDKVRIDEEAEIKKEFGLKNKKEIWKADAKVKSMRTKAKKLISASPEEQNALFDRLKKIGMKVDSIADVLALDKKDYLKRRLQTVLVDKKLATTPKGARQMITHKKVMVDGNVVNIPSYIVPVELEDKISLKKGAKKKVVKKVAEPKEVEELKEDKPNEERKEGNERR